VQAFWASPNMAARPGLKAVDMFRAVASGQIKAIWIIHTNPVVSMPEADAVAAALQACPFVVVSDITAATDTARLAHVLLPASAWAEKDGTVTNSDRTISRQRSVLPAPGQARDDWRIIAGVGARMGWPAAFNWPDAAAVFREYAALSGVAGALGSDFDISDHAKITAEDYADLVPFTWPANPRQRGGRFFGQGRFHTPDGRARMLPITPRAPQPLTPDLPFRLNTGRIRDQWHTMTRSALSPRLNRHLGEPYLEICRADALALGLGPADLVEVSNPQGRAILRVLIAETVAPGQVFAPMHWTGETAPSGRIGALVPGITDPVSGQPDSKAAPVALKRFQAGWHGFAVAAAPVAPSADYWAKARIEGGWRLDLAGRDVPEDWVAYARALFALPDTPAATVIDKARNRARIAFHQDGRLMAALFAGPEPVAVARDHLAARIGSDDAGHVLAGRPSAGVPDPGPTICACLNVGLNTIREAISDGRGMTVEALGQALGAGTSCGSCRPELSALITRYSLPEAAE
jgi:assimilatory nitrate reductase catalytic subunit